MSESTKEVPNNMIEELSYSTIRITCIKSNGKQSIGTGFVMSFKVDKDTHQFVPVLITNKHVVKDSVKVSFVLTEEIDGKPSTGRLPIELPIPESGWRMHPDPSVDLCAMPLGPLFNALKAQGKYAKISWLPTEVIATADDYSDMSQLDNVVMIGYPDAIADEVNNQPVFRRGSMATNPSLDYNGKKEFLIDIAAYNGSSGSPVFVYIEGVWYNRKSGRAHIVSQPFVKLIGVLYAGFKHEVDGAIVPVQIPTAVVPMSISAVPNNLGRVLKAERIKELEALF